MAHNKDQAQVLKELQLAKSKVEVGGKYFHYKHPENLYTVLDVGFIESTEESCVIYKAEYGDRITWVRSLTDFTAKVDLENGTKVNRFTKI